MTADAAAVTAAAAAPVMPALITVLGWDLGPFQIGVLGSAAVELVAIITIYDSNVANFPQKYKSIWFWLVRICVAVIGGFLAVVYNVNNLPAAFQIGASTTALVAAITTSRGGGGAGGRGGGGGTVGNDTVGG